MTRGSILCLAGLPLVAIATPAQASFVGAPMHLAYVARDGQGASATFADGTAVVVGELGTDVEFRAFAEAPAFDVDIDAFTIRIDRFSQPSLESDFFAPLPFLGLMFEDARNAVPPIESVTVVPSPLAMEGLVVTHDGDVIELNWQGLRFSPTTRIDLLVTFGADVPDDEVPEPSLVAATGLFALLLVKRRRKPSTSGA